VSAVSLVADLPDGAYVIKVDVARTVGNERGLILATPGRYFFWRGGYTGFSVPVTPYWKGEKVVSLVVDHLGGPLYVSLFDAFPGSGGDGAFYDTSAGVNSGKRSAQKPEVEGMKVLSIRRVEIATDETNRLKPVDLSPPQQWKQMEPMVLRQAGSNGSVELTGTPSLGVELLQSPPFNLEAKQRYILSLPTEAAQGAVQVGVLSSGGSWLAGPTLMSRRIVLETANATQATVVIANNGLGPQPLPLDVTIRPGTLRPVLPHELYMDRIMYRRRYGVKIQPPK
jgi:hypothetical protein